MSLASKPRLLRRAIFKLALMITDTFIEINKGDKKSARESDDIRESSTSKKVWLVANKRRTIETYFYPQLFNKIDTVPLFKDSQLFVT